MVCSYFKTLFLVCKGLALVGFGIKPCGKRNLLCVFVCVCVLAHACVSEHLWMCVYGCVYLCVSVCAYAWVWVHAEPLYFSTTLVGIKTCFNALYFSSFSLLLLIYPHSDTLRLAVLFCVFKWRSRLCMVAIALDIFMSVGYARHHDSNPGLFVCLGFPLWIMSLFCWLLSVWYLHLLFGKCVTLSCFLA